MVIYIQRKIFFRATIFLYSPCHYMRAWIHVLEAPGCYEPAARAERKSALQGSGLVRTVGPCAQRRVALMPRAITIARDALSNDRRESAASRGLLSRRGLFFIIPVSSSVATSSRVRTSPLHTYTLSFYVGCGLGNRFHLRMRTVPMPRQDTIKFCA